MRVWRGEDPLIELLPGERFSLNFSVRALTFERFTLWEAGSWMEVSVRRPFRMDTFF
jgi:hypothetical protein